MGLFTTPLQAYHYTKHNKNVTTLEAVRLASRSIPPQWGSIRLRPLICTYAPWGCIVRVGELAKSNGAYVQVGWRKHEKSPPGKYYRSVLWVGCPRAQAVCRVDGAAQERARCPPHQEGQDRRHHRPRRHQQRPLARVPATSRPTPHQCGAIRFLFRPLVCAYDAPPWGVRACR